jgi:hypothetical protein
MNREELAAEGHQNSGKLLALGFGDEEALGAVDEEVRPARSRQISARRPIRLA